MYNPRITKLNIHNFNPYSSRQQYSIIITAGRFNNLRAFIKKSIVTESFSDPFILKLESKSLLII